MILNKKSPRYCFPKSLIFDKDIIINSRPKNDHTNMIEIVLENGYDI